MSVREQWQCSTEKWAWKKYQKDSFIEIKRLRDKEMADKNNALIRSSAAEYLTYTAAVGGSENSMEMRYEDENI